VMGFGQYLTKYRYKANVVRTPGNYSLVQEGDLTFLRLEARDSVYLNQLVAIERGRQYRLSVHLRRPFGHAELKTTLCEKAVLSPFDCRCCQFEPSANCMGAYRQAMSLPIESGSLGVAEGAGPIVR
jgi:hypothetical protein